jgi:phospholipid/cholesterol/gamma-HCH transport system ATP-binding protein
VSAPSAAAVEFRRVRKRFEDRPVLRGVDLCIERGATFTILGGSGSGKSVCLKHMIGLLRADTGEIFVLGRDVTRLSEEDWVPVRRKFGMVFQGAALFDSVSVYENVAYPLRVHLDWTEAAVAARVRDCLAAVGLSGVERMLPAALSGGMRKRVGVARAIALEPEIILYDEPTTGLDPINVTRIDRLMNHLKATLKVTSVVVTHDMKSAFAVSDRIAMIHAGEVIYEGTPDEIRSTSDRQVRDFVEGNAPESEDTDTLLRVSG